MPPQNEQFHPFLWHCGCFGREFVPSQKRECFWRLVPCFCFLRGVTNHLVVGTSFDWGIIYKGFQSVESSEQIRKISTSPAVTRSFWLFAILYIYYIYKGWHWWHCAQGFFQDPNSWTNHLLRWGCPGEHAIVGFGSYVARQFRLQSSQSTCDSSRFEKVWSKQQPFFPLFSPSSHDLTCWGWKSCTAPSGKRILQFWMGIYQGKSLSHHFYFHCYLEFHGRSASPT